MRLIDADELTKDLKQYFTDGVLDGVSAKLVFNQILHDIDNAPTVKTFTLLDIEENYKKGLEKGLSEWETERPQGEWIMESKLDGGFGDGVLVSTCSICKKSFVYHGHTFNFCPNCGADMRGEKK